MKLLRVPLLSLSLAALVCAAGGFAFAEKPEPAGKSGRKACELEVKNALLAPPLAQKSVRDWTVIVFMSGKNDLTPAAYDDMREMEAVGSDDRVAIVTQFGTLLRNDRVDRYLVGKSGEKGSAELQSRPVESVKADMGSWSAFANFATWAMAKYPARRYALVLWNHGLGWSDLWGGSNRGAELSVGKNDLSMNEIRIGELGRALRQIKARSGKTPDLLGFDACYMAMLSVLAEVKDYAQVVTASQDLQPVGGYPYDRILAALKTDPAMDAEALGRVIVGAFGAAYSNKTHTAIKSSELPALYSALNSWSDAVMKSGADSAAVEAKFQAVASYGYHQAPDDASHPMSVDIASYITLVSEDRRLSENTEVSAATEKALGALDSAVLAYTGPGAGISEYMARSAYRPSYDDTKFARLSRWDDFIKWTINPRMFKDFARRP
ncbi:MAG: clostripain-related cysteine peptidase [Elusimicrobiaceae bacterium]|nr:clostripain-related cysteine peptidase [Elusimicrobiaceae bacterium]